VARIRNVVPLLRALSYGPAMCSTRGAPASNWLPRALLEQRSSRLGY